jgi:predicted dehydrogenase
MRVGIIGAGGAAQHLHLPVLANLSEVDVRWICDTDVRRAAHLAKLFSIDRHYGNLGECDDVEAVLVAIPVGSRGQVLSSVFDRGWHALCEKPVAATAGELDQYLRQAQDRHVQMGAGLMRRFAASTASARALVQSGCFGAVRRVWASEGTRMKRTGHDSGWYMADQRAVGGGAFMETGAHLVDQVCRILDAGDFELHQSTQIKYEGLDFQTRAIGEITTGRGERCPCIFEISRLEDLCDGIFVQFDHCMLRCETNCAGRLQLLDPEGAWLSELTTGATSESSAFHQEWKAFLEQCTSGAPGSVAAESARLSVKIIEDCYRSAEVTPVGSNWRQ